MNGEGNRVIPSSKNSTQGATKGAVPPQPKGSKGAPHGFSERTAVGQRCAEGSYGGTMAVLAAHGISPTVPRTLPWRQRWSCRPTQQYATQQLAVGILESVILMAYGRILTESSKHRTSGKLFVFHAMEAACEKTHARRWAPTSTRSSLQLAARTSGVTARS